MSPAMEAIRYELGVRLDDIENVLKRFGTMHWKVALIVGNPKNPKESLCLMNFDGPDAVCLMVRGAETGEVVEPQEEAQLEVMEGFSMAPLQKFDGDKA